MEIKLSCRRSRNMSYTDMKCLISDVDGWDFYPVEDFDWEEHWDEDDGVWIDDAVPSITHYVVYPRDMPEEDRVMLKLRGVKDEMALSEFLEFVREE